MLEALKIHKKNVSIAWFSPVCPPEPPPCSFALVSSLKGWSLQTTASFQLDSIHPRHQQDTRSQKENEVRVFLAPASSLPATLIICVCLPKGSSCQGPHTAVSPGSAWGSGAGHSLLSPLLPRRAKTSSCYQPRRAALFLHWSSLSPAYSSVNCPSLSSAQSPSLSVPSLAQQDGTTFNSLLGVTVIQLSWRPLSRLEVWAFACEWDIRDLDIRIRYYKFKTPIWLYKTS